MTSYRTIQAATSAELDTVYRLRQVAFANSDAEVLPGEVLTDEFDGQSNCISHLLLCGDQPAGTIRASVYSAAFRWQRIPALDSYEAEIVEALGSGLPVVQSSHFAVLPEYRTRSLETKARLYRAMLTTAADYQADSIITIVRDRPTQRSFYGKLGFRQIAQPRLHPVVNRMSVLLRTTRAEFAAWVDEQFSCTQ